MISIKLFKRMYKSKKTLAVILARGGSKGLPGKNIIPLKGRPLIAWTITAALEAKLIDRVVVSSDSVDILAVAKRYGADTIKRPKKLATDQIRPELAIQHVLATLRKNESYIPELLILLQPTSPLRTAEDIDNAVELLLKNYQLIRKWSDNNTTLNELVAQFTKKQDTLMVLWEILKS